MSETFHIRFGTVYERDDGHTMVVKDPTGEHSWGCVPLRTSPDGTQQVDFLGGDDNLENLVRVISQIDPDMLLQLLDEASLHSLGHVDAELHSYYEEAAQHPGRTLTRLKD